MLVRRSEPPADQSARLYVDGRVIAARRGESVATALLAAGVSPIRRTGLSGAARAPYCLMGVCFECLVTIDGQANRQACMTPVADGMKVETGQARPRLNGLAQPA